MNEMNNELHCAICATEPRQVYTNGNEYECPNENCEAHDLRLLEPFFSITKMRIQIEDLLKKVESLEKALKIQDLSVYGVSIEQGGARVPPEEFYKDEKDLKIEDLELKFQAAKNVAWRMCERVEYMKMHSDQFRTQVYKEEVNRFLDQEIEAELRRMKRE